MCVWVEGRESQGQRIGVTTYRHGSPGLLLDPVAKLKRLMLWVEKGIKNIQAV